MTNTDGTSITVRFDRSRHGEPRTHIFLTHELAVQAEFPGMAGETEKPSQEAVARRMREIELAQMEADDESARPDERIEALEFAVLGLGSVLRHLLDAHSGARDADDYRRTLAEVLGPVLKNTHESEN